MISIDAHCAITPSFDGPVHQRTSAFETGMIGTLPYGFVHNTGFRYQPPPPLLSVSGRQVVDICVSGLPARKGLSVHIHIPGSSMNIGQCSYGVHSVKNSLNRLNAAFEGQPTPDTDVPHRNYLRSRDTFAGDANPRCPVNKLLFFKKKKNLGVGRPPTNAFVQRD